MQEDFLAPKTEPRFIREMRGQVSLPPPRKKIEEAAKPKPARHFALANLDKYPPPRRRVRPEIQIVDDARFINDPIRPYPEWPLICAETNEMAFESESAAKKYSEKYSPQSGIFRFWVCEYCNHFHFKPYPLEVSGQSSGKALRKWNFLRLNGIEPKY